MGGGEKSRFDFKRIDVFDDGGDVVSQFISILGDGAKGKVDDGGFGLGFVGESGTRGEFFSSFFRFVSEVTVFGVGHEATRTEYFSEAG